jgi:hypothetical protein
MACGWGRFRKAQLATIEEEMAIDKMDAVVEERR